MKRSKKTRNAQSILLFASVFVVAAAGLGYELLAGTLSSYLLGNSVFHFSLVIGLFLTAMGLGSFLSKFVEKNLLRIFVSVEIAIGLIGGLAALILFFAFAVLGNYIVVLVAVCVSVGALVGLEIPLMVRIVREQTDLKEALGNVLSLDYLGALAVSLLFPLVLVPHLGLVRSGAIFGALNVLVALLGLWVFRNKIGPCRRLRFVSGSALLILLTVFSTAGYTTTLLEDAIYDDDIVYAKSTAYQRIVVTKWRSDIRLYLDGNIQFSSTDEFRYHESLVHPVMGLVARPKRVLVLGGGDGLAVREILRYSHVEQVDLVDLDPEITRLFRDNALLSKLNEGALKDERVRVWNEDALKFLENTATVWDVIIVDLPDPNNETLAKLYSRSFYRLLAKRLSKNGAFVTQATSPFYATDAFWCIVNTIRATTTAGAADPLSANLHAKGYWASVPSFGDWGFVLGSNRDFSPEKIALKVHTRYLTPEMLPSLFVFPKDIDYRETEINRLDAPILVDLYLRGYRAFH